MVSVAMSLWGTFRIDRHLASVPLLIAPALITIKKTLLRFFFFLFSSRRIKTVTAVRVAKGEKFQPCNRARRAIDKLHLLQRTKQHAKEAEEEEKERTNERKKKLFVIKECGPESVSELQKKLKEEEKISTRTVYSCNLRSSASSSPSSCSLFYYYYYYWCHTEEESQRTPILNTNKMCHFLFSSLLKLLLPTFAHKGQPCWAAVDSWRCTWKQMFSIFNYDRATVQRRQWPRRWITFFISFFLLYKIIQISSWYRRRCRILATLMTVSYPSSLLLHCNLLFTIWQNCKLGRQYDSIM